MKLNDAQSESLLSTADLLKRYGVSDTTLRTWRKQRDFPLPMTFNSRVLRWNRSAVMDWERRHAPAYTGAA